MRRKLNWFRCLFGGALLALLLGGLPAVGLAQNTGVTGAAIYVPTGGTIRLQMQSKKPIKRVTNPRDSVLSIRTVFGDPTTILLTGQQSDVTRLELEDEAGVKEVYEVVVQRDIENLKTQLKRAVPTAAVVPTPISDNTVILGGTVAGPEDVEILINVAKSLGFQVINAMRVGGVQQVQLDVVIAEVSRSDLRSLTFNFETNSKNFFFGHNTGGALGNISTAGGSNGAGALGPASFGPLIGNVGNANVLTGVLHSGWGFLAFIQALRTESVAKITAEPHQVTISGRPSNFHSGGQQAIPSGGGINGVGAQFIPFGTDINALPIVLGNGKIYLEIDARLEDLSASSVNIGGALVANRISHSVTTTVELESGQTFVIGGIVTHHVTGTDDKVPVLGDVPFFGVFFSSKSFTESEEEVIILVTPHLVDAQDCAQAPKILPGQETRRPDDFELFLEGILEAPRGQREVCPDGRYVPAYRSGPSADQFPCAVNSGLLGNHNGGCGKGGCGAGTCTGGCNGGCGATPAAPATAPAAPAVLPPTGARADEAKTPATAQADEGPTPPAGKADEVKPPFTAAPKVDVNGTPLPDNTPPPLNLPAGGAAPAGEPKE
jgi:pilus assembly protein CpaC